MLLLVLMVTLVLIGLSVTLPSITGQIRRDREDEMIHRGAQYARAIKRYYRKFGSYPVSIEQLQNTNRMRFLRQRYKDPITGKDFRLLHVGEVQLNGAISSPSTGGTQSGASSSSSTAGQSGTSSSSSTAGQSGFLGSSPQSSSPGSPTGSTSQQPSSPFVSLTQMGATGPAFGGGPILGVASTSEKQGFHIFNNKSHYNEWAFIYDPSSDRGALIKGPYNGPPKFGAQGQIPGAVSPAQMQSGTSGSNSPGSSTFGASPMTSSPFGQSTSPSH